MQDDWITKAVEIDALTEAGNIGAGHAATSLSKLLREHVMNISSTSVMTTIDCVPEVLGGAERVVAGIYTSFSGELNGSLLMLFPEESAKCIARKLGNCELQDYCLDDFQASLLSEVGNICLCWYVSAISKMIGIDIIPDPPAAAYDMAGAVLDLPLVKLGMFSDHALVIMTNFEGEVNNIEGIFLMLPDQESQRLIAKRLGVA